VKPIIIAIVGASGSGKTYLSKFLRDELNIPIIVSHTTRPMREGEIEGEDYFFINSTEGYNQDGMLSHTKFGGYEYFSLRSQLPKSGFCTCVMEETGSQHLKRNSGDNYGLFSVIVQCSPEVRTARGVDPKRIERDHNRKPLSYEWVDYAIDNDGTVEELEKAALNMIKILEQWQHLR